MFMQNAKSFLNSQKVALEAAGVLQAPDAAITGILSGSLIETTSGWLPVERLGSGMSVSTWDGGFKPLVRVLRHHVWPAPSLQVVHIPGGALGNCSDVTVMPVQPIVIESAEAEAVFGDATVLVAAGQLAGHRGITLRPLGRPVETITLDFGSEELVYVNSGLRMHCARVADRHGAAGPGFFRTLTRAQARALIELIDAGARSSADVSGRLRHAA